MAEYNYAFQNFNKELMARAVGRDLGISPKQSIELCNYLRHRKLPQAKATLERVIKKEQAIPFKRFTNGLGHRAGKMTSGRFPVNTAKAFLELLESVEANAQSKGLNTGNLEIIHLCAQRSAKQMHYGRHHGLQFKKTHVEVVVQETVKKAESKESKSKKEKTPKTEAKK